MANDVLIPAVTGTFASLVTGLATFYATRTTAKNSQTQGEQNLLKMLMDERREREAEMRALRADLERLQTHYEESEKQRHEIAMDRIKFAEQQSQQRHDLKAQVRAQQSEIEELKERVRELEATT